MSRTINIPKEAVFQSWKMVKENQGSYGIDSSQLVTLKQISRLIFIVFGIASAQGAIILLE
jgi:hypothetical protein